MGDKEFGTEVLNQSYDLLNRQIEIKLLKIEENPLELGASANQELVNEKVLEIAEKEKHTDAVPDPDDTYPLPVPANDSIPGETLSVSQKREMQDLIDTNLAYHKSLSLNGYTIVLGSLLSYIQFTGRDCPLESELFYIQQLFFVCYTLFSFVNQTVLHNIVDRCRIWVERASSTHAQDYTRANESVGSLAENEQDCCSCTRLYFYLRTLKRKPLQLLCWAALLANTCVIAVYFYLIVRAKREGICNDVNVGVIGSINFFTIFGFLFYVNSMFSKIRDFSPQFI